MLNLGTLRLNGRRAAALGALAIGLVTFSGAASAAPFPLFPFIAEPPAQMAPPVVQPAPSQDENATAELPARLRRCRKKR